MVGCLQGFFFKKKKCSVYSKPELSENDDYELDKDYEYGTAKQKLLTTLKLIDKYPTPTNWMIDRVF